MVVDSRWTLFSDQTSLPMQDVNLRSLLIPCELVNYLLHILRSYALVHSKSVYIVTQR